MHPIEMHIHVQIVNAVDFLLSVIDLLLLAICTFVRALHTDMSARMYVPYIYANYSTSVRTPHVRDASRREYTCKKYLAASHFPRLR